MKKHPHISQILNKIIFYVFVSLTLVACNRTFKNEDDLKQWLSGKEFSSQNADYTTYDIYGKSNTHPQKLTIRFDGDKVQYNNCLSAPYDISHTTDDYEVVFKIPCLDEYFTIVLKPDGKILTKSVIYDYEYAYNRSEYVENRPNGISKLDALTKLERKEVDGPELVLRHEKIVISDKGVDTTTRVKNFRNDEVNWATQKRIQARLDSDYANVNMDSPKKDSSNTINEVSNSALDDSDNNGGFKMFNGTYESGGGTIYFFHGGSVTFSLIGQNSIEGVIKKGNENEYYLYFTKPNEVPNLSTEHWNLFSKNIPIAKILTTENSEFLKMEWLGLFNFQSRNREYLETGTDIEKTTILKKKK